MDKYYYDQFTKEKWGKMGYVPLHIGMPPYRQVKCRGRTWIYYIRGQMRLATMKQLTLLEQKEHT